MIVFKDVSGTVGVEYLKIFLKEAKLILISQFLSSKISEIIEKMICPYKYPSIAFNAVESSETK